MKVVLSVTLESESPEYQELQSVLTDLANSGTSISEEQYVTNIVINWLETRVRETYHAQMRLMTVSDIQQKMGNYDAAKNAAKGK